MKKVNKILILSFICVLLVSIFILFADRAYYAIDARKNIKANVSTELISVDAYEINNTENEHYFFYNNSFQIDENKEYDYFLCLVEVVNNSNNQCVSNVYFKNNKSDNIIIQSRIDVFDTYTILPHSKEVIPIAIQIKKQDKKKATKSIFDELPKRINIDLTKSKNNEDELDYSCSVSISLSKTDEDFTNRNISFPVIY